MSVFANGTGTLTPLRRPGRPKWPAGGPTIEEVRDHLAAEVCSDAIEDYEDACHRCRAIEERIAWDGDMDTWLNLAQGQREAAEIRLIHAILAWRFSDRQNGPRIGSLDDTADAHRRYWPAVSVSYRGRLYAAVPGPDYAGRTDLEIGEEMDSRVMMLAVLDPAEAPPVLDADAHRVDLEGLLRVGLHSSAKLMPRTDPEWGAREAAMDDRMEEHTPGIHAAYAARDAAEERVAARHPEPAWTLCTQDIVLNHVSAEMTLDEVIADELENIGGDAFEEAAVWRGDSLLAAIVHGPDGKPVVHRFDRPAKPTPKRRKGRTRARG